MTVEEITADAKKLFLAFFDSIQSIHDECTAKQNLVENVDEHEAYKKLLANPPADAASALKASGAIIAIVNYKHAALLKAKAEKLAAIRKFLVG